MNNILKIENFEKKKKTLYLISSCCTYLVPKTSFTMDKFCNTTQQWL